jgi:hypothetical protein
MPRCGNLVVNPPNAVVSHRDERRHADLQRKRQLGGLSRSCRRYALRGDAVPREAVLIANRVVEHIATYRRRPRPGNPVGIA